MGEAAVLTAMTPVDSSSPWVRANDLAGGLNRLYAALVAVTVSVIAADDWGAHGGVRSPEHWLALRAGLAAATARQVVALARRASMLPLMIRLLDEAVSRADRYRIYLHLDIGGAWLNARGAIPRHLADRYACISAHAVILERDGKPVNVGRTQRGIPARTRRLVEDRDRGCAYPGCPATRFVEIHHLHHWEDGGGTDYDNLICLCPHHQTGHHQGAFTITPAKPTSSAGAIAADDRHHGGSARHRDGVLCPFVFHDDRGRPIQVQPPPPRPDSAAGRAADVEQAAPTSHWASRTAGASYRGPLGEHLDLNWVRFYRDSERHRFAAPDWAATPGPLG